MNQTDLRTVSDELPPAPAPPPHPTPLDLFNLIYSGIITKPLGGAVHPGLRAINKRTKYPGHLRDSWNDKSLEYWRDLQKSCQNTTHYFNIAFK